MGGNRVPKSVEDELMENENIIGKARGISRADFIATDRRVIRFGGLGGKSRYSSIEYEKISIKLLRHNMRINIGRVMLAALGFILITMAIVMLWGPTTHDNGTTTNWGGPPALAVIALIAAAVCFWFVVKFYRFYQIESPGMHKKELLKWRIQRPRWGASKEDEFARIVREGIDRAAKH